MWLVWKKKKRMVECDDPRSEEESDSDKKQVGHIYSVAAHNGVLYTGGNNIRVWGNTNHLSAPLKSNSTGLVKAILISGDRIFTAHQDGKVRVWNTNHKRIATLPSFFASKTKHTDVVSCLAASPDTTLLYSASWDRTFKVWNLRNFKCLESVQAHHDAINSLVVSALDGSVYTASADGTVKVWRRAQEGHLLHRTLHRQESAVTALALTASGLLLYSGSSDGAVTFWELEKHGGVLKGHQLAVLCLETAGSLLFSGSADKTICVWRREVGAVHTCLSVLSGHTGPVKCLAAEDAGDNKWKVYSGSLDKTIKVWTVSEMAPDLHRIGLMQFRDGDST